MTAPDASKTKQAALAAPNFYSRLTMSGDALIFRTRDSLCICRVYSMPLAQVVLDALNGGGAQ